MICPDQKSCTGCGVCSAVCPQNAIEMAEDAAGFYYPSVKDGCIKCGKCLRSCPIDKELFLPLKGAYAYQNEDAVILKNSTSGGAFYKIAAHIIKAGGVVYGCAYDENFKAKHIRVDSAEHLHLLQGSKYLQSDVTGIYPALQKDVQGGKPVLFSGTPCQNAGVRSLFGEGQQNLLLADVVCHGVPSQKMFDNYLRHLEKKHGGRIVRYSFRDKAFRGWSCSGTADILCGEKVKHLKLNPSRHYFYHAFLSGANYRPSCYSCRYARPERTADFTLGDFWGVEKYLPDMAKNGCSVILANTDAAELLLKKMDANVRPTQTEWIFKGNAQLTHPQECPPYYDEVVSMLADDSSLNIDSNYRSRFRRALQKARMIEMIPPPIKGILKRFL